MGCINLENEKTAIVSVPKGRVYYRYIVDGKEQYDPDKDIELFNGTLYRISLDKLYNYVDATDVGCEEEKNLMDASEDDLERLAAELNSDRLSISSNKEPLINTSNSPITKAEKGNTKVAQSNKVKVKSAASVQTDLTIEDINKWQR